MLSTNPGLDPSKNNSHTIAILEVAVTAKLALSHILESSPYSLVVPTFFGQLEELNKNAPLEPDEQLKQVILLLVKNNVNSGNDQEFRLITSLSATYLNLFDCSLLISRYPELQVFIEEKLLQIRDSIGEASSLNTKLDSFRQPTTPLKDLEAIDTQLKHFASLSSNMLAELKNNLSEKMMAPPEAPTSDNEAVTIRREKLKKKLTSRKRIKTRLVEMSSTRNLYSSILEFNDFLTRLRNKKSTDEEILKTLQCTEEALRNLVNLDMHFREKAISIQLNDVPEYKLNLDGIKTVSDWAIKKLSDLKSIKKQEDQFVPCLSPRTVERPFELLVEDNPVPPEKKKQAEDFAAGQIVIMTRCMNNIRNCLRLMSLFNQTNTESFKSYSEAFSQLEKMRNSIRDQVQLHQPIDKKQIKDDLIPLKKMSTGALKQFKKLNNELQKPAIEKNIEGYQKGIAEFLNKEKSVILRKAAEDAQTKLADFQTFMSTHQLSVSTQLPDFVSTQTGFQQLTLWAEQELKKSLEMVKTMKQAQIYSLANGGLFKEFNEKAVVPAPTVKQRPFL